MSLYPPHGGHHHGPPPPMGPVHRPAPPRANQYQQLQHQQLHHDPNAFRQYYASHLASLTFNSRPIIQNLSMLAQQFVHWSAIVTQCLEAHIRTVPPPLKLPAFYLLDSICKNIYNEYAHTLAPLVAPLFLDAYRLVDPDTQRKMEEMLVTWRTGAPGGRELFGVVPQIDIERVVFGGQTSTGGHHRSQHHRPAPTPITKRQVLAELEVTLAQKQRAAQANPYDQMTTQQVDTLVQLRDMIQYTDIAPQDLVAIQAQLQSLAPSVPAPAPPAPVARPLPVHTGYPPSETHGYSHPPPPINVLPSVQPPTAAAQPPSGTPNILNLYDALLKAGIVSSDTPRTTPPATSDPIFDAELAYEAGVLSMNVTTSSNDIIRKRPAIASLLYRRLPAQCKQCSLRFADDEAGKKSLQDHLDLHFRQNMRANQNTGRGHSRSWFVGHEDWTTEKAAGSSKGRGRAAAIEASAERDAKLRASFVVVPAGEEAKPVHCPICKEQLKSEFQEDDEEWIWRNAVKVGDKIYHATCHADAFVENPLVSRLKGFATASRSRSLTPDPTPAARSSVSPTSESRGMKRKAEAEVDSVHIKFESGTPPLKRIALHA